MILISNVLTRRTLEIGCAGEVCVAPHEDYDNWGIEIRVKFRYAIKDFADSLFSSNYRVLYHPEITKSYSY